MCKEQHARLIILASRLAAAVERNPTMDNLNAWEETIEEMLEVLQGPSMQ